MERQQPLGDVDTAVGIDADQVVVEGGVVDLGRRNSVREHRLSQELVGVGHDVRGIEQMIVGQIANRASVVVAARTRRGMPPGAVSA